MRFRFGYTPCCFRPRITVAVAESGRNGQIRYLGEIDNSPGTVEKVIGKPASRYAKLHVCYEAGTTGYGQYARSRLLITIARWLRHR